MWKEIVSWTTSERSQRQNPSIRATEKWILDARQPYGAQSKSDTVENELGSRLETTKLKGMPQTKVLRDLE